MSTIEPPRLVVYARTSTDDNQSPEDSLRWQEEQSRLLVRDRAVVVDVRHDVDVSRSVPWARRPVASELLAAMADPGRGWDGIVVGEPQRAFGDAAQYQHVAAVMAHHGIELWIPEIGGPVDFGSDTHDVMLNLFGSLSRGERNRLRKRVTDGMTAHARAGRFLGGRPPYGYRLIDTGVPHPKADLARHGVNLTTLSPDPETVPTVRRIFDLRVHGAGFRAIARILNEDGAPSPSASDPDRNLHRRRSGWTQGAVKAIVENPRYKGTERWGAMSKVEKLLDPTDPTAGHRTSRRRRSTDDAAYVTVDGLVPALVDADLWEHAQTGRRHPGQPRPFDGQRASVTGGVRTYPLSGVLTCAHCGNRMGAETRKYRNGREVPRHVCRLRDKYPGEDLGDHPKKLAVNEHAIVPLVDAWLTTLLDRKNREVLLQQVLNSSLDVGDQERLADLDRLHQAKKSAQARLDRIYELMEDPDYPVDRARMKLIEAKAELERVTHDAARAAAAEQAGSLDTNSVALLLDDLGGWAGLLDAASREERGELYKAMGLHLSCSHADGHLTLSGRLEPAWESGSCRRGDLNPHAPKGTSPSS